jgi:hypothetical protein
VRFRAKKMGQASQGACPILKLEHKPCPQLNYAGRVCIGGLAKLGIIQIGMDALQIDAIQDVEEFESQLQIYLVIEHVKPVVLDHAGINVDETRVPVCRSLEISFRSNGRDSKHRSRSYPVNILTAREAPRKFRCGHVWKIK